MPWAEGDALSPTNLNNASGAVFNVKDADYGALGDGSTDDTTAIQAALTAATDDAGTVFLPDGTYEISALLEIPRHVSLVGTGKSTIRATSAITGPMVRAQHTDGGFGTRHGVVRDIVIDGNDLATQGLACGLGCVQRLFQNIHIKDCTSIGWIVVGQNNRFVNVNSEGNGSNATGDCNLSVDLGAGNNVFVGCELSASNPAVTNEAKYNLIIQQSGASGSGGFDQPEANTFVGCQFERTATNQLGSVLQSAGRNNVFNSCSFQTVGATVAVTCTDADAVISNGMTFNSCRFSGTLASSTAFSLTDTNSLFVSECFLENFNVGFLLDDNSSLEITETLRAGSVTTLVSMSGSNSEEQGVAYGRFGRNNGLPSGTPENLIAGSNPVHYDATNNRLWLYNGEWVSVQLSPQVTNLANDATPSVAGKRLLRTGGTTTITDFDDGVIGQELVILAAHAVTITDNAAIFLDGGVNFDMTNQDTLTLQMFNDQIWHETGRAVS